MKKILLSENARAHGFLIPVASILIDSSCDLAGVGKGGDEEGDERITAEAIRAAIIAAMRSFLFTTK